MNIFFVLFILFSFNIKNVIGSDIDAYLEKSNFQKNTKEMVRTRLVDCKNSEGFCLDLSNLCIDDSHFVESIYPFLKKNPQITKLILSENTLSDKIFSEDLELKLEEINLSGNNLMGHLKKSPDNYQVIKMDLSENALLTFEGIKTLCGIKSLNSIALRNISLDNSIFSKYIVGDEVAYFLSKNKLKILDISANSVTQKGVEFLLGNNFFVNLIVKFNEIEDFFSENIVINKTLKELDISGTDISDIFLSSIAKNKNLLKLNVSFTNITNKGLKELSSNQNIKILHIDNNRLCDDDVKSLTEMKLNELSVRNNHLTEDSLFIFEKIHLLKFLNLKGNIIKKQLSEAFKDMDVLL